MTLRRAPARASTFRRLTVATWSLCLAASALNVPAGAIAGAEPTASQPIGVTPALACEDLASETLFNPLGGTDLTQLEGAPARVLDAVEVEAAEGVPAFCQLNGYIWPEILFEIRLPTETWNGRYLQTGCGGFCGEVPIDRCGDALAMNFAVGAEDSGHTGGDGLWARGNPQARIDFGYRSPHALSILAKALISLYYGQEASYSYYRGCSMGGRQAFVNAQWYPTDFDGILAGHPAFQVLQGSISNNWLAQNGRREDDSIILTEDRLAVLNDAALAACDELDELADGLVDDPRNCEFDPADAGLTEEELAVARAFYAGPHEADGTRVYPGWVSPGGERDWFGAVTISTFYANQALRFMVFEEDPPLSYTFRDFNFDTDVPKLRRALDIYDVINPDLTAFREAGGKFMSYHGWGDTTVSAMVSIDIYHEIAKRNGGTEAIDSWYRLFTIPGMYHCGGGPQNARIGLGGDRPAGMEPLLQLVEWVEHDTPPDQLIVSYLDEDGEPVRTRPVYPYPTVARYLGSGSIDDAANFGPADPPVLHDGDVKWIWDPGEGMNVDSAD
jgi:feruloyl esterase